MSTLPSILLVEDNPMDVDLTLRAFKRRRLNNPVEIARDGEEALAWLPRWEAGAVFPAVILLDLKLPRVDGLEVLRRLKDHPGGRAHDLGGEPGRAISLFDRRELLHR